MRKKILVLGLGLVFAFPPFSRIESQSKMLDEKVVRERMGSLSIPFIENEGQVKEKSVRFYAKTFAGTLFITDKGEMVYAFRGKEDKQVAIKESLIGAKGSNPRGKEKSITRVNYFIGDRKNWRSNIPTYQVISLGEVYEGIDLELKAYGKNVEKIFTITPGAQVEKIRVRIKGAQDLRVNGKKELEIETKLGIVNMTKPFAYQEIGGRREEVKVAYVVERNTYGFKVGNYNPERPLIIDPLIASTFIGGSAHDAGFAIALDSSGNVYVAGETLSDDYPHPTATFGPCDSENVFVSKLNSDLTRLLASTFIGGSNEDSAQAITLDFSGNVYVAGRTGSSDYPTTPLAYNEDHSGGGFDVFVSKLNSGLTSLLASTFIGGGSEDRGQAIAFTLNTIDPGPAPAYIYVTGYTLSTDYPTTSGAYNEDHSGNFDVFVSRLANNLTGLSFASTYIGGSDMDFGYALTLDSLVNVYVTGRTGSDDYPTTPLAYNETHNGVSDVFISRLSGNLAAPPVGTFASTFIGGSGDDSGQAIALDSSGNVYVTGETRSTDYPTTSGAYDETYNGISDVPVSKLNSDLTTLSASTLIGGVLDEIGYALTLDSSGNVYVTGHTSSTDYPTTSGAYDETYNGNRDAFVSKFNSGLTTLPVSTFIGGDVDDRGRAITLDSSGNVYITGHTSSDDYPATPLAYGELYNGGIYDVIVSILDLNLPAVSGAAAGVGGSCTYCFLATAAYSSHELRVAGYESNPLPITRPPRSSPKAMVWGYPLPDNPVTVLCSFRDQYLLTNQIGRAFVHFYYSHSPRVADFIRDREPLKAIVRAGLKPLVWIANKVIH